MNQLFTTAVWSIGVAIAVFALAMTVRDNPNSVQRLRRVHIFVGVFAIGAFVLTGQYMQYVYSHSEAVEGATRLMFRSAHIYVLYGALLNVVLGAYLKPLIGRLGRRLQIFGSVGVIAVPVLLLVSFVTESQNIPFHRPIAIAAIYLSLVGCALHLAASLSSAERDAA